jgi:hypothetical protein
MYRGQLLKCITQGISQAGAREFEADDKTLTYSVWRYPSIAAPLIRS